MADYTTSQGIEVFQSGDPGFAINQGMPTADSVDAALSRVADVAVPRQLAAGTNWDNLRKTADFYIPTTGQSFTGALPPLNGREPVGTLQIRDVHNSTGNLQVQEYTDYLDGIKWTRSSATTGTWSAWQSGARNDPASTVTGDARRAVIVDSAFRRRGKVGTGGLGAVALRFDHHLDPFQTKVLPLLRQYRLPWAQIVNPGKVGSGDDTWGYAELANAAYRGGGEVWHHGWSHVNIGSEFTANREITNSMTSLLSSLPDLWIDGWAMPGTGGANMGLDGTAASYWSSLPGRMVLAQHALVRGSNPSAWHALNGGTGNVVGASHVTLDAATVSTAQGWVNTARDSQTGVTLMLHANYLDTAGYMTTAQLGEVLAYIAAERDAGRLAVLTPSAILLADRGATQRAGTLLSPAAASPGATTTAWSETVTTRTAAGQYGVPHEAVAHVRATAAGTVSLSVAITAGGTTRTEQHSLSMTSGQVARLTVPVTPPLTTTSTVVTLSGQAAHTGIYYGSV